MRVISVTGGKGGIGKTTISINLAVAFAKMKKKVMLFDADLGLANVDVLLGLKPDKTIHEVYLGKCGIQDICLQGPHGIKIVPSSSGIQQMAELNVQESANIIHAFSALQDEIDVMIIDMASGVSKQVIDFTNATQDILAVICNDPSSLMDSYAVIKILHQKYARNRFGIIVNKIKNEEEGFDVFRRFQSASSSFLNVNMNYLGHVPHDDYISIAARERVSIVDKYPHTQAAQAFQTIGKSITHWHDENKIEGGINFFFDRLVQNQ